MQRPAPVLSDDNEQFWAAAREGRLVAERCRSCGQLRHPPRPMCPRCHALDPEWIDLSGRGAIYSYAVLHHPRNPAFDYPLTTVLVDLDEGVRMASNLVGAARDEVAIGARVKVAFEPTADDGAVPVFELDGGDAR